MPYGVLVVLGSGPGIGVATASHFVAKGFSSVALLARNRERLQAGAESIRRVNKTTVVHTYAVDIGDATALSNTLKQTGENSNCLYRFSCFD